MIALYQNGEAIRPEQGFPMRLLLPGFEGNMNVKWLRRLNRDRHAGGRPGRDFALYGADAEREGAPIHVSAGREIRDSQAVVWNDHEGAGILRSLRTGMVGSGPHFESGSFRGWRQDLGACGAERAGVAKGADAIPLAVAMGWAALHADEPGHGRNWRHAANRARLGRAICAGAGRTTSTAFRAGASRPTGR